MRQSYFGFLLQETKIVLNILGGFRHITDLDVAGQACGFTMLVKLQEMVAIPLR